MVSGTRMEEAGDLLLYRQVTDVPDERPDERLGETSIVEVENILNNVVTCLLARFDLRCTLDSPKRILY